MTTNMTLDKVRAQIADREARQVHPYSDALTDAALKLLPQEERAKILKARARRLKREKSK